MADKWRPSTWGDEISLEYGKSLKGYRESGGNIQVFGSNGAVGWTTKALSDGPGVILGRKGAYRGVRYSKDPFFVIDTAYYVKPKTDLDMQWLYYSIIYHKLGEIDDGSPIPSTTRAAVYVTDVDIPPLPEQKAIAHILGTLDDKIELNRRMNATLEGMAQALFKSWFVDFDPVIDNALAAAKPIPDELAARAEVRRQALANGTANRKAAKPFPAAFQPTEKMGWIPEGWEVSKAEAVVTRHKVKQKFTKKNALAEGSVPIFDQGAGLLLGYSNEPADQDSSKENPKFIFGDHTCITHLSTRPFSVGPNVIPLSAKPYAPYWTFYAIKDLQEFQEYRRHWMEFSIKQVILPALKLAEVFDGQIRELRASMESNDEISKTLTKLRDTLLPKLISGELRIPEAEQLIEKTLDV